MRYETALLCVLAGLVVAACNDGSTVPDPIDGSVPVADAHVDPPPPLPEPVDCAMDPISHFAGVVTALADRAPIAGAMVCVIDHPEIPCATTNAEGFYDLACAPLGDAAISFAADGFSGGIWLWAAQADAAPVDLNISLVSAAENSAYLAPTGVVYPDGASSLVTIDLVGAGAAGLTARMSRGAAMGPFYSADEGGRIDPAATSVSSDSELVFFVARPDPGWSEIEIALTPSPGTQCREAGGAWVSREGAPNAMRVPVRPGFETVIAVRCE